MNLYEFAYRQPPDFSETAWKELLEVREVKNKDNSSEAWKGWREKHAKELFAYERACYENLSNFWYLVDRYIEFKDSEAMSYIKEFSRRLGFDIKSEEQKILFSCRANDALNLPSINA